MKTFFSGVAVVVLCCAGLRPGRQRNRENRRYCVGKQRGEALRHGPASGSGKLVKYAAGR